MSEQTERAAPDLSHLEYEDRVNLALVMREGTLRWYFQESDGSWTLDSATEPRGAFVAALLGSGRYVTTRALPDPMREDGAAWRLMLTEKIDVRWDGEEGYAATWDSIHYGSRGEIREAVCLAVLSKFGIPAPERQE